MAAAFLLLAGVAAGCGGGAGDARVGNDSTTTRQPTVNGKPSPKRQSPFVVLAQEGFSTRLWGVLVEESGKSKELDLSRWRWAIGVFRGKVAFPAPHWKLVDLTNGTEVAAGDLPSSTSRLDATSAPLLGPVSGIGSPPTWLIAPFGSRSVVSVDASGKQLARFDACDEGDRFVDYRSADATVDTAHVCLSAEGFAIITNADDVANKPTPSVVAGSIINTRGAVDPKLGAVYLTDGSTLTAVDPRAGTALWRHELAPRPAIDPFLFTCGSRLVVTTDVDTSYTNRQTEVLDVNSGHVTYKQEPRQGADVVCVGGRVVLYSPGGSESLVLTESGDRVDFTLPGEPMNDSFPVIVKTLAEEIGLVSAVFDSRGKSVGLPDNCRTPLPVKVSDQVLVCRFSVGAESPLRTRVVEVGGTELAEIASSEQMSDLYVWSVGNHGLLALVRTDNSALDLWDPQADRVVYSYAF